MKSAQARTFRIAERDILVLAFVMVQESDLKETRLMFNNFHFLKPHHEMKMGRLADRG
ncbi:hypothetical protein ACI0FM_14115 [Paenochrobactrum sp. BZR 588]|uniref:hypothetical protein n=1 Tax=Paenochrobactrum TaxID=999488 RepID=UPI0035BBD340